MRMLTPFVVVLFACVIARAAQPSTFGHFKYAVPPGWKETRYANAVLLAPANPPKGQHLDLALLPPRPHNGTLAEAALVSYDDVCLMNGLTKKRTVDNLPYDIV